MQVVEKRSRSLFPNRYTAGNFLVEESLGDFGIDPDSPKYPRRIARCPAAREPPVGDLIDDRRGSVDLVQDQMEADVLVIHRFLHDVIGRLEGFVKPWQVVVGDDSRGVGTAFERQGCRHGRAEIQYADGYSC